MPVHLEGFFESDPHVETELLFPLGDHIVLFRPDNRNKDKLGEVHDGQVLAGEQESVIIAVNGPEDDDTDGSVLVETGLEFGDGFLDEVVIGLSDGQFFGQELKLDGLLQEGLEDG